MVKPIIIDPVEIAHDMGAVHWSEASDYARSHDEHNPKNATAVWQFMHEEFNPYTRPRSPSPEALRLVAYPRDEVVAWAGRMASWIEKPDFSPYVTRQTLAFAVDFANDYLGAEPPIPRISRQK